MPKIEVSEIEDKIEHLEYKTVGVLTVCIIRLDNGFYAVGESAPVDPAEYDYEVGKQWAYKKALDKCFLGEAYLRKELDYIAGEDGDLPAYEGDDSWYFGDA